MADTDHNTGKIVTNLILKILHAILDARIPGLAQACSPPDEASAVATRNYDRWFNLALGQLPPTMQIPSFCLHGIKEPTFIDIILLSPHRATALIIERWSVLFASPSSSSTSNTYRDSTLLLRSLYSVLRLLPSYPPLFRSIYSSNQTPNYSITYKVTSFVPPFSEREDREFDRYSLTTVKTNLGGISVSVLYRRELPDITPSLPHQKIVSTSPSIPKHSGEPAVHHHIRATCRSSRGLRPSLATLKGLCLRLREHSSKLVRFNTTGNNQITKAWIKEVEDMVSSRLVMDDNVEDFDLHCPFAMVDTGTSASESSNRSRDAVLGELIHMLDKAPPLSHCGSSRSLKAELSGEVGITRNISDALEELGRYREIKFTLLSRNGAELTDSMAETREQDFHVFEQLTDAILYGALLWRRR